MNLGITLNVQRSFVWFLAVLGEICEWLQWIPYQAALRGRDVALRGPRRVQRRNGSSDLFEHAAYFGGRSDSARCDAGGDVAAQRPYLGRPLGSGGGRLRSTQNSEEPFVFSRRSFFCAVCFVGLDDALH